MKKIISVVLFVVLAAGSVLSLTGCDTTYKINYHIEGALVDDKPTPTSYKLSRKDVDLWMPAEPDGMTFDGWYTTDDYNGMRIDFLPAGSKTDVDFYGRFYKNSGYNITYIVDGEEVNPAGISTTYRYSNSDTALWTPTPEIGFNFQGWFTSPQRTEQMSFIPKKSIGDITLYGYIEEGVLTERTITFYLDGEVVDSPQKTYTASSATIALWTPTYNAQLNSFDGWYTNDNLTENKMSAIPAATNKDLELYGRLAQPVGYETATGRKASPNFLLNNNGEGVVRKLDLIGEVVVLNFWSSKCSACVSEMPDMQKVYDKEKDNVVFLFINSLKMSDTVAAATEYMEKSGWTFPWYYDIPVEGQNNSVTNLFGVGGIPVTIILDRWGFVAYNHYGTISEAKLLAEIAKVK